MQISLRDLDSQRINIPCIDVNTEVRVTTKICWEMDINFIGKEWYDGREVQDRVSQGRRARFMGLEEQCMSLRVLLSN